ncbi:MAG: efflux RND transporter periplasmic adaptor subunit [Deltaproteobacteria bacterium]|nr:efflux RND transporter periplasmic adaptor subunit [Deltaproteobacteria bacterium]
MKRFVCILPVLLVISLVMAFMAGCNPGESWIQDQTDKRSKGSAGEAGSNMVKVSIIAITPTPIRDVQVLPGEMKPWQDVLVSASIGGEVEWIGPHEGETVKKGEMLVKINVSALKASLDRAKAAYELADKVYQRLKRLHERQIITQESLDKASTERTLAQGTLKQIKVEYEKGFVHAPITGRINKLFVDAGEFVGPGAPILELVNVRRLKVEVNVPEMDVRYLKVGQKVMVRVDAFQNRIMEGTISFVAYKADPATRTFRVSVAVENSESAVRAGMIARVAFIRRQIPDALIVPLSALVDKNGERLIFVEEDGVARARTVTIGVIEKDRVQITRGLRAGDHLIVSGHQKLEEGMRVLVQ